MKTGPKYKICRRLGEKVFSKCQTTKFATSGSSIGGKGGGRGGSGGRPKSLTEYGRQLLEKQKARYVYGVGERQFTNYVKSSRHGGQNSPAERLYQAMEARLDNIVYRAGFAISRAFARQMVSHGHITVDGRRVNIPSYQVRPGQVVGIKEASRGKGMYRELVERLKEYKLPEWLEVESETAVKINRLPTQTTEHSLDFGPIIEFYSRV